MALSSEDVGAIDAMLAAGGEASVLEGFRPRFPGFSLTRCDESDVDAETPFRQFPGGSLFLVDGQDHCWHITADPSRATGIVLARRRGPA